jgi:trehalose-phosphatase
MTVILDPRRLDAVIFDLDGVITDTASVHAAAWRWMFDEFLTGRAGRHGEDHRPFTDRDYRSYVDGMPRYDGVRRFLASRGISLPEGDTSDSADADTVHGLGNRKDRYFRQRLETGGVQVFRSTVALVHQLQRAGIGTAVFSASRNCQPVLAAAGLADLFPVRVDGVVAAELGLPGKPDPAMLLEAVRRLGAGPDRCAVVEDAEAGVAAGRRGGFEFVIGVDRHGDPGRLRDRGADVVVADLSEVQVAPRRRLSQVPDLLASWDTLAGALRARQLAVFLDYDGTLSPIVDDPGAASLADGAGAVLSRLAQRYPVAIISGRDLSDLRDRVGVDGLWYAGSHGFELVGPAGEHYAHEPARAALPALEAAGRQLRDRLAGVPGARVEHKGYSLAAHYRRVDADRVDEVVGAARDIGGRYGQLRVTEGRRVVELRPDVAWDKGRALKLLLDRTTGPGPVLPVYAGDDLTDEDALTAVASGGLGIVVRSDELGDRMTAAHAAVDGPRELVEALRRLADEQ